MVDRRVFFSTLLYGSFAFVSIMSTEVGHFIVVICMYSMMLLMQLLPLFLVTNIEDGGYSLDDNELGLIFMISAIIQLLYHVRMTTIMHLICD